MPSDMQEIIAAAEKLGQLVAQHPAIAKYRQAQREVGQDPDASRLMGEFGRQLETLARQEQSGVALTDAQRSKLESMQMQIASNLKVKAMNIAEVDFTDLLRKVSQAWQKPLAEASGQAASALRQSTGPRVVQ